ncbi:hypothetical protein JOC69_000585 [Heliobacterium gestii]|nr:hypothetical protein [Heliomicrobium gestii]
MLPKQEIVYHKKMSFVNRGVFSKGVKKGVSQVLPSG